MQWLLLLPRLLDKIHVAMEGSVRVTVDLQHLSSAHHQLGTSFYL